MEPKALSILVLLGLACVGPVERAAWSEVPEFRGSLTSRAASDFRSGHLQLAETLVEPELTGSLGSNVSYTLIGRARFDLADELEPGDPGAQAYARSAWNRRVFAGNDADFELREAYADIYAGDWFVRAGKQQVVWGQADGLRVLDRVNPLSLREFIIGDFEDRRIPLWMLNVERLIGPVTAQFLWIPDTTYNEVPPQGMFVFTSARYRPTVPQTATSVRFNPADRPDKVIADSDVGVRITGFSGGWDWSLNALHAYLDSPVFRRTGTGSGRIDFTPTYYRSTLLGGSASNAFGKVTLRSEFGYQSRSPMLTRDPNDSDGVTVSPELSGVLGLDYQADADTLISGQLFVSHRTQNDPLTVVDQTAYSVSVLGSREFDHDQLKLQFLLLQNINDGDGLLQLSARRNLTGALTLRVGADIFYGDSDGFYGQFEAADRATIALEDGF